MYKTALTDGNRQNVAGLSYTQIKSFTTPSAASFFGNRGEREALAQLAMEHKKMFFYQTVLKDKERAEHFFYAHNKSQV